MNLNNRKVRRFRAHIDPQIGPTPRNAFDVESHGIEAELTPAGVYVRLRKPNKDGTFEEHIVPYANVQSIKLYPEEKVEEAKAEEKPAGKKSKEEKAA